MSTRLHYVKYQQQIKVILALCFACLYLTSRVVSFVVVVVALRLLVAFFIL